MSSAVALPLGRAPMVLPEELSIGDFIDSNIEKVRRIIEIDEKQFPKLYAIQKVQELAFL